MAAEFVVWWTYSTDRYGAHGWDTASREFPTEEAAREAYDAKPSNPRTSVVALFRVDPTERPGRRLKTVAWKRRKTEPTGRRWLPWEHVGRPFFEYEPRRAKEVR